MTDEEKKTIKWMKNNINFCIMTDKENKRILNLIENQDNRIKELEKALENKNRTIENMVEKIIDYKDYLEGLSDDCQQDCFLYHKVSDCNLFKDCKNCVKEYFEKKEG